MRFGIIPTSLAERLAIKFGKLPVPAIDTLVAINQVRALMNLVKCGAFEALRDGPRDAAAIAQTTNTNADVLQMLLRIAHSAGYVARAGSQWQLTALGRRHMLKGAEFDLTGTVLFKFFEWDLVENMDQVLYTGEGTAFHTTITDPAFWSAYQRSMLELAAHNAPQVAKMVPVPSWGKSLLDVAGSHGKFGAEICRLHPGMQSTVLELPAAIPHAEQLAQEAGVTDVVSHVEGDMFAGNYPGGQDVVFFANIVHHFTPQQNVEIMRHALAALHAGGTVAIWDIERMPDDAPPELAGDALALYFRITSGSATFTADDYASWLREAGFSEVQTKRSPFMPRWVLTVGKK